MWKTRLGKRTLLVRSHAAPKHSLDNGGGDAGDAGGVHGVGGGSGGGDIMEMIDEMLLLVMLM